MNLTNRIPAQADQSFEFVSTRPLGNPTRAEASCVSETQLLDPSAIQENSSFCISSQESFRKPFLLRADQNNSQFYDLADEFEIVNRSANYLNHMAKDKDCQLQQICKDLMQVASKLSKKLEKFQESIDKSQLHKSESSVSSEDSHRKSIIESISKLTSSTGSKQSATHLCNLQKDQLLEAILQLIEARGQIKIYKAQHEQMQSQLVRLKVANEQQRSDLKKKNAQIMKMKELLRQYQIYHKKSKVKEITSNSKKDVSLEKRLKSDPDADRSYLSKAYEVFNVKETPKTPNNLGYHAYKQSLNLEKTKARQNNSAEHNLIRQLMGFSNSDQKLNRRQILGSLPQKTKQRPMKQTSGFYQKYPFNELLEMDTTLNNAFQSDEHKSDHLSTMQSLPELCEPAENKRESRESSNYCFRKYIPSSQL